jgi:hypothetical protein
MASDLTHPYDIYQDIRERTEMACEAFLGDYIDADTLILLLESLGYWHSSRFNPEEKGLIHTLILEMGHANFALESTSGRKRSRIEADLLESLRAHTEKLLQAIRLHESSPQAGHSALYRAIAEDDWLRCPRCDTWWEAGDKAPLLMCPKCLLPMHNPGFVVGESIIRRLNRPCAPSSAWWRWWRRWRGG